MDLTLALGRPIGAMPEREFRRWSSYASTTGLPLRRLEYAIAYGAMQIALSIGAQGVKLENFVLPRQLFVSADDAPPHFDEDHEFNG